MIWNLQMIVCVALSNAAWDDDSIVEVVGPYHHCDRIERGAPWDLCDFEIEIDASDPAMSLSSVEAARFTRSYFTV